MTTHNDETSVETISDEEMMAKDLIQHGEIDQAIAIYQQLKTQSARILSIIAGLYADEKGNYELAIIYYEQALQMQEQNGEDISDTLTQLGFACQNLREYDLALSYHTRALTLRQAQPNIDQTLVASSLFGIANALWGQENLSEALVYAQQSLAINKSITSGNDSHIASNLAILGNIYHCSGDDIRALEFTKQALTIFENRACTNPLALISVLNNIGTIQVSTGLFKDALMTFIRVSHICQEHLPENHPRRQAIDENVQRIANMQHEDIMYSVSHFSTFFPKILLL